MECRSQTDNAILRAINALDATLPVEKTFELHADICQAKLVQAATQVICNALEARSIPQGGWGCGCLATKHCTASKLTLSLQVADLRPNAILVCLRVRQALLQVDNLQIKLSRSIACPLLLICKFRLQGVSLLLALASGGEFKCRNGANRRIKTHASAEVLHASCNAAGISLKASDLLPLRGGYFARLAIKCRASLLDATSFFLKASNLLLLLSKFSLDVSELLLIDRSLGLCRSKCRRKLIRESCPTIFSRFCGALEEATVRCLSEDIIHHGGRHWIALCLLEDFLHLWKVDLPCGANRV